MKVKVFISAMVFLVVAKLIWFRATHNDKKKVLTPVERCIEEGTKPLVCACINEKMQKEVTQEKVEAFRKGLKTNDLDSEPILQLFQKIKKECLK